VPTKDIELMSYDDDAGDRLKLLLAARQLSFAPRLTRAAELAGQQLELLKPSVAMIGDRGEFIAGPVAAVRRGTILIVLANARRVFTIHITRPAEGTLADIFDDLVDRILAEFAPDPWTPSNTVVAIKTTVEVHGAAPGRENPKGPVSPIITAQIVGTLFAATNQTERHDLAAQLEACVDNDVCPAMIGVIGRGTKPGSTCGVWPLLLPLSRYLETAVGNPA
jgi:hypothetical protein